MVLKVLGSSSSGNCYILDNGDEALIIEAGVRFIDVKKAIGFNFRKVVGCLITHAHGDHSKYAKIMVDKGIHTLALPEVFNARDSWGSRAKVVEVGKWYKIGGFKVLPFPAYHDVPCLGYIIDHPSCGKLLFLTDSYDCPYRFGKLNHILIECNYSEKNLVDAIRDGRTLLSQRARLLQSHMEFETCKEILRGIDLGDVQDIVLLHLSDNNSDEGYFVSEIERLTGKAVYAAKKGLTICIDKV